MFSFQITHTLPNTHANHRSNPPQVAILALDINTAAMELILDMSVALRWVDPRLTYYNLKVDNVLNTLTLNNLLDIWSPEVRWMSVSI